MRMLYSVVRVAVTVKTKEARKTVIKFRIIKRHQISSRLVWGVLGVLPYIILFVNPSTVCINS